MSEDWNIEFRVTGPLELEETTSSTAILNGVFLKLNSVTKNGREYQIEEGEAIASGLLGMPVFFGADPLTNKHLKSPENRIGRVIKTLFDKAKNTIRGAIEIFNTKSFPDIVQRVKSGWGFSIGGKARDLRNTGLLNTIGRAIKKVFGMRPNHLQLLEPLIPRGQEDAQVGDVALQETLEIEETIDFDPCPWGACMIEESGEVSPITPEEGEEVKEEPEYTPAVYDGKHEKPIVIRKLFILEDPDSTLKQVE